MAQFIRRLRIFALLAAPLFCSIIASHSAAATPGAGKWVFPTGTVVRSSPAIGPDGTIYVGSDDHYLYAINPDGTQKWEFQTGNTVVSSPTIGPDGTIYVGSADSNLYAVNPDGIEKWRFPTGIWVYSSPAIGPDGTIYIGSYDHNLYAVNPNGTQKWVFDAGDLIWSSPAIGPDGTIYVGSTDSFLYAINPNGVQQWVFPTGGMIESSPAIGPDGTIYVGSDDRKLYAITPNGSLKWSYTTGSFVTSSPSIGPDGTIYVGSTDSFLYAINPDGTKKWEFGTGSWVVSSPSLGKDGTVYVGSYDTNLYAINPDGSEKWNFPTLGPVDSCPVIAKDGTVYVGSGDGNLYAVSGASKGLAASSWPMFRHDLKHGAEARIANLVETSVAGAPETIPWGGKITVTDTVANQGNSSSSSSSTSYFLSSPGRDILIGVKKLGALAAGATMTRTASFAVGVGITPGFYALKACATNDARSCTGGTSIKVTAPNLTESYVLPSVTTVSAGGSFQVTDTVNNTGGAAAKASTTRYYLSPGTTRWNAYLVGSRAVGALAPGASSTPSPGAKATVAKTVPVGLYYLVVCADDRYAIAESAETDNCIYYTTRIEVTNP